MLLHLMTDTDVAVKLTAASSLKICVDDFDFELESFLPFTKDSINLCMKLIEEVDEFESKLSVLSCLSVIVQRLEEKVCIYFKFTIKVTPFALHIITALSYMWQISEGQNMFRSSIVSLLTKLVTVFFRYLTFRLFVKNRQI